MGHTYPYPRPSLTVDVVVFTADAGRLKVLLIRRGRAPFAGRWALPGGFVDQDEDLPVAAARELVEETGLDARLGPQLGAYGTPGRDPRGHTVSVVYLAWAPGAPAVTGLDDATDARWQPARRPPKLAFDHRDVLRDAVGELERRANLGLEACLELLPTTFSVPQVQELWIAAGRESASGHGPRIIRECRSSTRVRELQKEAGRLRFRCR